MVLLILEDVNKSGVSKTIEMTGTRYTVSTDVLLSNINVICLYKN